jgi:spermidine/putrescine-binding protein
MNYIVVALLLLAGSALAQNNQVRILSQSGLLTKAVIRKMEGNTGLNLQVSNYDTAEEAYAKVTGMANAAYDLVVLPDYLLADLIRSTKLSQLNKARLTNLKNLEASATKLAFDPGNRYSVGLLYSLVGLAYRSDRVSPAPTAWSALFKPANKLPFALLDGYREAFAAALIYQKQSVNSTDEKAIAAATNLLQKTRTATGSLGLSPSRYSIEELGTGKISLAMTFSHDALRAGGKIAFAVPREGGVRVLFNLVIPAKSSNVVGAHKVINSLLEANTGKLLAEEARAATPNQAARKLISATQLGNPNIWPGAERLRTLYSLANQKTDATFSSSWIAVKQ